MKVCRFLQIVIVIVAMMMVEISQLKHDKDYNTLHEP